MPETTISAQPDLFSAVAAYIRGDLEGLDLLLGDISSAGDAQAVTVTAAMTCGEYLRDAAERRGLSSLWMVDVLRDAHGSMIVGGERVPATVFVLSAVRRYLAGDHHLWDGTLAQAGWEDPAELVRGAVVVTAAALSWHANDLGVSPSDLATTTCLSLARIQCPQIV